MRVSLNATLNCIVVHNCNQSKLTCNKFELGGNRFLACAAATELLTPLDADDSLDINETVSLNAESLSGLSVRGSRI